jgi:hypothetical protein
LRHELGKISKMYEENKLTPIEKKFIGEIGVKKHDKEEKGN